MRNVKFVILRHIYPFWQKPSLLIQYFGPTIFATSRKKVLRPKWTIKKHDSDKNKKCLSVGNFRIPAVLAIICQYIIYTQSCLKYCIFTKLSQTVYLINTHNLVCWYVRCDCQLSKVIGFKFVLLISKYYYIFETRPRNKFWKYQVYS